MHVCRLASRLQSTQAGSISARIRGAARHVQCRLCAGERQGMRQSAAASLAHTPECLQSVLKRTGCIKPHKVDLGLQSILLNSTWLSPACFTQDGSCNASHRQQRAVRGRYTLHELIGILMQMRHCEIERVCCPHARCRQRRSAQRAAPAPLQRGWWRGLGSQVSVAAVHALRCAQACTNHH